MPNGVESLHLNHAVLSQRLGLGKGGLRMAPEEALSEILHVCNLFFNLFYSARLQPILSSINDLVTWFTLIMRIVYSLALSSLKINRNIYKEDSLHRLSMIPVLLLHV